MNSSNRAKKARVDGFAGRAARLVIDRGMISPGEIHRHGIRARDVSQSNPVALVEAGNGRGFLAKDMSSAPAAEQGTPERELDLYRAVAPHPKLQSVLPVFHGYDDVAKVMFLEGLSTSRRLDQIHGSRHVLDPEVASWFGEALGTWHLGATSLRGLSGPTPWLLLIGTEQRLPVLESEAELKELVARIMADPTLRTVMDRVREEWRRLTIIHGDIRFANVMVRTSPPSVRFVDWETSGVGDPLWDVAGAVQEYISIGAAGGNEFAESPAEPAVMAFLAAYRQACDLPFPSSRLPRFVACRLLMRAIQLANWEGDAAEGIEDHLELARHLATDARELPDSWLSRIMPECSIPSSSVRPSTWRAANRRRSPPTWLV